MPEEIDNEELRRQLNIFRKRPEYAALLPFLTQLEPYLNVGGKAGVVKEGLALATELQRQGIQTRGGLQDAAANFINQGVQGGTIVEVARDIKVEGDIVFQLFNQALKDIKVPELGVEITFVIVAMTAAEAQELHSKAAFSNELSVLQDNYEALETHLKNSGHVNWVANYGSTSEAWRPRGGNSIAEHVDEALSALNEAGEFPKKLIPKLYDVRALHGGTVQGRNVLRRLRTVGCVVVVDAISLRHPAVIRSFQRSLLDVFPSTSVLILTPDADVLQLMYSMVYALQSSFQESEFGIRLKDPLDGLSCSANSDVTSIGKWMVERVRKIYSSSVSGDGIRSKMQW